MQTVKLLLTLTEQDVPVPDTGTVVPDTGVFTGMSSDVVANPATIVISVLMFTILAVVAGVAIHKLYRVGKMKVAIPVFLLFGLLFATFIPFIINSNSIIAADDYPDIEVTEEVEMSEKISESTFVSGEVPVTKLAATDWGYNLYALADELDFVPETEGNNTVITSIAEQGALTANTYGFTLEEGATAEDEVWYPLSDVAEIVDAHNSATDENSVTNVYFGILTDDSVVADTYELDVDFYATLQLATIDKLTYMQDFNGLSATDLTNVKSSMTLNEQYQLEDERDNKVYYIARIGDGNIWMTQNLDHDIVTDTNFYTPDNTDISENWTASKATYTDEDVSDWAGSANSPESYDPGELCWNGTIEDIWDYTIATSAVDCNGEEVEPHYTIGNYYNYSAAVAMNDTSSYNTDGASADQSICPAGWTLPGSGNDSGSFAYMLSGLSIPTAAPGYQAIKNSPIYFAYVGDYRGKSNAFGATGRYRTGVVRDATRAYNLYAASGEELGPKASSNRAYGFSVRCIVRQ